MDMTIHFSNGTVLQFDQDEFLPEDMQGFVAELVARTHIALPPFRDAEGDAVRIFINPLHVVRTTLADDSEEAVLDDGLEDKLAAPAASDHLEPHERAYTTDHRPYRVMNGDIFVAYGCVACTASAGSDQVVPWPCPFTPASEAVV